MELSHSLLLQVQYSRTSSFHKALHYLYFFREMLGNASPAIVNLKQTICPNTLCRFAENASQDVILFSWFENNVFVTLVR